MPQAVWAELGQNVTDMTLLTDDGTHKFFKSSARFWSKYPGRTPVVRPNGVLAGGVVTPAASETNDAVDISQLTAYLNGTDKSGSNAIAADTDVLVAREVTNPYLKASVCLKADGTFYILEGTAHATAWSDTRGADGGPPLIPVDEVEIAQIHLDSTTSAVIAADEIKSVPSTHREMALLPAPQIRYMTVEDRVLGYAGVYFSTAQPLIHVGPAAARVYASWYTPDFTLLQDVRNFQVPTNTGSNSSETFYDRKKGYLTSSLGAGGFEWDPDDRIGDPLYAIMEKEVWWKYYQDMTDSKYIAVLAAPFESATYNAEGASPSTVTLVAPVKGERIIA